MLEFIKKIFSEKKEPVKVKKETIALSDVGLWLENKEKDMKKELMETIESDLNQFSHELERLEGDLSRLKEAALRNKNITPKEKHFLDGNKKAYYLRMNQLIKSLRTPKKFSELSDFMDNFEKQLKEVSRGTAKQYQVISHFHAHEVREIALHIKQLETIYKRINKDVKSFNIDKFETMRKEVDSLFFKLKEHEEKRKKLISKQSLLEKRKNELNIKNDELRKVLESPGYEQTLKQKEELIAIEEEKKRLEFQIRSQFSHVPLKKRSRIDDNPLIQAYDNDPVSTLITDFDFNIIGILRDIRNAIEKGSMDLKDAKKRKALEAIGHLDISFLRGVINQLNEVSKKNIRITEMIDNNKHYIKKGRCEHAIRSLTQEIEDLKDEILSIQEFIEKLQADSFKREFEEHISQLTDTDIRLRG
jgi:hypothetical protein